MMRAWMGSAGLPPVTKVRRHLSTMWPGTYTMAGYWPSCSSAATVMMVLPVPISAMTMADLRSRKDRAVAMLRCA